MKTTSPLPNTIINGLTNKNTKKIIIWNTGNSAIPNVKHRLLAFPIRNSLWPNEVYNRAQVSVFFWILSYRDAE